jgi:undecaprenyl diphosphate synthase
MPLFKSKLPQDETQLLKQYGVDPKRLPVHVAIIMDGNGRWALHRGMPRVYGHRVGVERLCDITRMSSHIGIKVLTIYAFSTENWKRPFEEVNALMDLLVEFLKNKTEELHQNNVLIRTLGDSQQLPGRGQEELNRSMEKTRHNTGMILNLALNYGGRAEILRMVKMVASQIEEGAMTSAAIDENIISSHLYTSNQPDPDLVIRTGGEWRLSNFMLYQTAYSELIFIKTLWPNFNEIEFAKTLKEFQSRNRRYGGI